MPGRLVVVATVAFAVHAAPASAQIFMTESATRDTHGSWSVDIGPQMAQPIGAFRSNVHRAWGFGTAVRYNFRKLRPLGLRGDFGFLNYGNERKRVPLSPTVNRVNVKMTTSNNIALVTGGPELRLTRGPVRPYVYAFAGYSYFFTESSVGDDNGDNGGFASTTNFDDGGFATGWGGGVRIPLRIRSMEAAFDAGARLTRNGARTYLRRGDIIDLPDGSLQLTSRTTLADFWQYQIGMSFGPRLR